MKKLLFAILCLLIISPVFAEGIPIVRIENVENNASKMSNPQPLKGFRLLEFDPKTKSMKKLPDVESDMMRQNEIKVDDIRKEETGKIKLEKTKFDGFEG